MMKFFALIGCAVVLFVPASPAQNAAPASDADLMFVVYFSRHGVRSPTGKAAQYDKYSTGAWPKWDVAPGILTPHGYHLMELFGAYDRLQLTHQGLFTADACSDAAHVTFYADSDQRTRETGNALAKGLFPYCTVSVPSLPEGTNDPLFHLPPADVAHADNAQAVAAIAGRIGGEPGNVTQAYRQQLEAFDNLLATCGKPSPDGAKRTSLLDVPVALSGGQGDHLVDLRGPINTASTLSENPALGIYRGNAKCAGGAGAASTAQRFARSSTSTPPQQTSRSAHLPSQNSNRQISSTASRGPNGSGSEAPRGSRRAEQAG